MRTKSKIKENPFWENTTGKVMEVTLEYRESGEFFRHVLEPGESICVIPEGTAERPHIRCRESRYLW